MLHLACLKAYDDIHSVIHCHAKFCTMFAITHQPIPCVIEEVEAFVGGDVPVANYKFTGSQDLADEVSKWVGDRAAVLMANHGLLTVGKSPKDALKIANIVEITAEMVWGARVLGDLVPLPEKTRQKMAPSTRCSAACDILFGYEAPTLHRPCDASSAAGPPFCACAAGATCSTFPAEGEAVGDREHHRFDAVVGRDHVVERLDRAGVVVVGVGLRRRGRPRARCRRAARRWDAGASRSPRSTPGIRACRRR